MARPTPVLPEVGSTMVPPGRSLPSRSAASIMGRPIRSLTEPPGFRYSSLATMRAGSPRVIRCSWTSGVPPTRSRTVGYSRGISAPSQKSHTLVRLQIVARRRPQSPRYSRYRGSLRPCHARFSLARSSRNLWDGALAKAPELVAKKAHGGGDQDGHRRGRHVAHTCALHQRRQHAQVDAKGEHADRQEAGVLVVGHTVTDAKRPHPVPCEIRAGRNHEGDGE